MRRVLADCRVWAVVGLGDNPDRPAYGVARFLQQQGKKIVPVHPSAATVLGERGYASLADVPFPVDCVDVFRRSEVAGESADEAVAIGAKAVWFQLGVVDRAAYERTTAAGLDVVMDHCPAIEWAANGPSGR
ncbi:CoA-binding protein [Actinosynnema pretiosum]|uniref:CoA-binding protein n=1 Tax=Actinosynnema pretiosum TaxID=42197 RepID=A0A290ZHF0_9PSEU|nr:CoA-binding protein [Actinosynnema pretiosum]